MGRGLKRAVAVLGLFAVLAAVLASLALRRLDTPEFQKALVERAGAALGTQLRVARLELGLLSGVTLEGVGVANPPPLRGDLLTAESVALRHRLWPLLSGRLIVDRLELLRPRLSLVADSRGAFNYERLGARSAPSGATPVALPLRLLLSRFAIDDGTLRVSDATRAQLLQIEELRVRAAVEAGPEGLRSDGRLDGALQGGGLAGRLDAEARLERAAGARSATGQGRADIASCRVESSALFALLSAALGLPELAKPEMDECRVEFRLGGGRVVLPVVSLKGPAAQLTGTGSVVLATGGLDFEMNLALRASLLERVPAKELRAAFKDRGDGYGVLPFSLRGTTSRPETDLAARLARAAAGEAAKGKLKQILDKVF